MSNVGCYVIDVTRVYTGACSIFDDDDDAVHEAALWVGYYAVL